MISLSQKTKIEPKERKLINGNHMVTNYQLMTYKSSNSCVLHFRPDKSAPNLQCFAYILTQSYNIVHV